ncbi:hypothetical protein DL767_004750 [Monosporascus sp. MG133]|nr:hypothetical protein DL767_004750 [Monosporascus sp. MG133]
MPRPSDIADVGELVEKDGQIKYKCQIEKPDGTKCGAVIQNNKHSIGSHRKVHNPNSKHHGLKGRGEAMKLYRKYGV